MAKIVKIDATCRKKGHEQLLMVVYEGPALYNVVNTSIGGCYVERKTENGWLVVSAEEAEEVKAEVRAELLSWGVIAKF